MEGVAEDKSRVLCGRFCGHYELADACEETSVGQLLLHAPRIFDPRCQCYLVRLRERSLLQ